MTPQDMQTCFVVMPITVPGHLIDRYGGRVDHFEKIYDALISPSIVAAGLTPVPPSRSGTENIHAAIINDLRDADLVLADLSALNPNVFLELGIRSALDKPVCLVWDGFDSLPFDSGSLNTHKYDSRPVYELNREIASLSSFITATTQKSDGRNELWKFFGSASTALPTAELDPVDASLHSKLDRLIDFVEREPERQFPRTSQPPSPEQVQAVTTAVTSELLSAGEKGVHGTIIGSLCRSILGEAYEGFLGGTTLSQALGLAGTPIRTNPGGWFVLDQSAI